VTLTIPDVVREWLAARGYDPVYGARPLKRLIQQELVNPLAKQLLRREEQGEPAHFDVKVAKSGDQLEFLEVFDDVKAWAQDSVGLDGDGLDGVGLEPDGLDQESGSS